ncbi:hypothetical protein JCM19238_3521 [Vibrio ponticus]|nr:hypothetical protein JCM19238_3521 [Vibrio ponticus]
MTNYFESPFVGKPIEDQITNQTSLWVNTVTTRAITTSTALMTVRVT